MFDSSENDERSYQNIPKKRSEAPAPEVQDQGPAAYANVPRPRPQPAKRLSQHGAADNKPVSVHHWMNKQIVWLTQSDTLCIFL